MHGSINSERQSVRDLERTGAARLPHPVQGSSGWALSMSPEGLGRIGNLLKCPETARDCSKQGGHQMLASAHSLLRFDAFTLDPVRCVLMRGASELPLRRQSFEVLRYLAEHAGKVVSNDELIDAVWLSKPADHTSSVGQCIKEIRQRSVMTPAGSSRRCRATATSLKRRLCELDRHETECFGFSEITSRTSVRFPVCTRSCPGRGSTTNHLRGGDRGGLGSGDLRVADLDAPGARAFNHAHDGVPHYCSAALHRAGLGG